MDTTLRALACFSGAVLGIMIYAAQPRAAWLLVPAFAALWLIVHAAQAGFARNPRRARLAIEFWPLSTALVAAGIAFLTFMSTLALSEGYVAARLGFDADEAKAAVAILLAAIAAFLSLIVGKQAEAGEGFFSVPRKFRTAIQTAYKELYPGQNAVDFGPFRAAFKEDIVGIGDVGWDFAGRAARTDVFSRPSN